MWSVDPSGGFRFADRFAGQLILFSGDFLDTNPLKRALKQKFGNNETTIEDIQLFTLVETPFLDTHIKNKTLRPMEKSGELEVIWRPGQTGYGPATRIKFSLVRNTTSSCGSSLQVTPSSSRPFCFGVLPPHCLKKKAVLETMH